MLEKTIRFAGAFLVGAWVARYLGPERYGTFAYATALIATLGFMASWGIESLVIRDLVQEPRRQQQIVSTYFLVRICGAIFVPGIAVAFLLWSHPGESELLLVSIVLSVAMLLSSMDVADCWLQAQQRSSATSLIRLVGFLIGAVAKCVLVLVGAPLVWFAATNALESTVIAVAYWFLLRKGGVTVALGNWDFNELKRLVLDGKTMMLSGLTVVIYSRLDVLAIGSLISKQALGPYAMAASMCGAWNMVGMSVAQAWAPHISAARASDAANYIRVLRRFLLACLMMSVTGSLAIAGMSTVIFDQLLGPAYSAGGKILSILVWSSVPVFLGMATSQIIVNDKLYWVSLFRTSLGMLISLALVAPAALRFGVNGVAVVVIGSACMATLAILVSPSARQTISQVCKFKRVAQ
jgi:PST family polysaccharide transporter